MKSLLQAFLTPLGRVGDYKSAETLSFFLEFWVFSWVLSFFLSFDIFFMFYLKKLVIFHTKMSESFKKVPTFWALALSFEFFPWVLKFWGFFRLEFFSERRFCQLLLLKSPLKKKELMHCSNKKIEFLTNAPFHKLLNIAWNNSLYQSYLLFSSWKEVPYVWDHISK